MGHSNKYKESPSTGEIERINPHTVPWYKKRLILEHEMRYKFSQQYAKGNTILDIACGSGFGSALLADSAKKVYAIDNDPHVIKQAKYLYKKANIIFTVGDAQEIKMKNKTIDMAVSFETIEHLSDPKKFLQEIRRVLNETGILVLSTPNKNFSHGDNPYHIKEFSFAELSALLSHFKTVEFYGQRPVNKKIFVVYKEMEKLFPFAKKLFRFRPWEKILIKKITDNTNYLYFIAICRK